jgi:hypothetical protein
MSAKRLVIALPGLRVSPEDFETNGFAATLKGKADMIVPSLGPNDYIERNFALTLKERVILPAQAAGYARIAFLALSSGALGALRYVVRFAVDIEGLIFLAPFLANPGTIAQIEQAGGLASWTVDQLSPTDIERPGLLWLKRWAAEGGARPWLHLAFGTEDRFQAGARLLAAEMPPSRVTACPGGHDWPTWVRLWQAMLPHLPIAIA